MTRLCTVPDCGRELDRRGYCKMHYVRWWKHGTTSLGRHQNGKENPGYKHGMTNSPEYSSWHAMKNRCLNQNFHKYHLYGGRGITICDEWINSFENFYR